MESGENLTEVQKIFKLYTQINRSYIGKSFHQIKQHGVYPGQIPILQVLYENDGSSQKEIARKLQITPPTVNVSIQRLEKAGIVYRKKDEKDQRVTRVFMTEAGKEKVTSMIDCVKENEKTLLHGFTDVELCLLRRFFEQIVQNMEDMPGEIEEGLQYFHEGGSIND